MNINRIGFILLFVILAYAPSCAQKKAGSWLMNGIPATDSPDHKTVNGFGGVIIVVRDPKAFVEMWNKPDFPDFDTVKDVGPSIQIGTFVMFAGCKPGSNGKCDTTVDYSLIDPAGKVSQTPPDQVIWNEVPPPKQNTHISKASMVLKFRESDQRGTYTVKAVVHDKNADISFELETKFELK